MSPPVHALVDGLSDNPYGYAEPIWRHFAQPRHAGSFAPGTAGLVRGEAGSPAVRSLLRIELRFEAGRVAEARFKAYGCPTSIAVGDWIADWAVGRDVAALRGLDAAQLRATLEIPEDRAHCALMGEDALRAALAAAPEVAATGVES